MDQEILLITNYFPPESGAAPNRMASLAQGLGKNNFKVEVICPLPNYPRGEIFKQYKVKLFDKEKTSYGTVNRLWVWPSNSTNKIIRLLSMFSFSFSLLLYFLFQRTPKTIFVQYSPVFVGFTAVLLGKILSKKVILNVSDLWPLAGLEMGILKKGWYYSQLLKMERYCYRNADLIVGQSQEIIEHIKVFEKDTPCFLYRNLPDFPPPLLSRETSKKEIKIVYAGLLGMAQGIFGLCQKIKWPKGITFHIYGAGPEAEKIKNLKNPSIYFHGELERNSLHIALQDYDIAVVPLTKRIYGSVPSKIFEYSRLGLPILYFAGGEGGDLVQSNKLGWVIPVNDIDALQEFINKLTSMEIQKFPKIEIRERSINAFAFEKQFSEFVPFIRNI